MTEFSAYITMGILFASVLILALLRVIFDVLTPRD